MNNELMIPFNKHLKKNHQKARYNLYIRTGKWDALCYREDMFINVVDSYGPLFCFIFANSFMKIKHKL